MKSSKTTIKSARAARNEKRGTVGNKSKYGQKSRRGEQMFGPGCCAHRVKLDYWAG